MESLVNVLVTGGDGFIAKNLCDHLIRTPKVNLIKFNRSDSDHYLRMQLEKAGVVFHLAGENRPLDESDFEKVNKELTERICEILIDLKSRVCFILASSIQATQDNAYGISKLGAEAAAINLHKLNRNPVIIYRLPGVFGKWSKPNYNSVVATFCHNVANDLPIHVDDEAKQLSLVHIDDVVKSFLDVYNFSQKDIRFVDISPIYKVSLGDLAQHIYSFAESRR